MIVSIDALRPDLALRANMPHLRALMDRGSYTFWARTTAMAITLPSHTSMLTGVIPDKHGIYWNADLPFKEPIYPAYPTLFELAKKAGYSTALAAGKAKFRILAKPNTVDQLFLTGDIGTDEEVAAGALRIIREHQPQVFFVHFPDVDTVGHLAGWGSSAQLAVIERADGYLGQLLSALDDLKLLDGTLIIVSSDHGGEGKVHGPDDERSRNIPWIVAGPSVRPNYDLTLDEKLVVHTEDTFATACYWLGIHVRNKVDGQPVTQILKPANP